MAIEKYKPKTNKTKSLDKWTLFWDMHSGGPTKVEPYDKIYIEADEDTAVHIFEEKFNRSPYNVTCQCCGTDYSITSSKTLAEATEFHRGKLFSNSPTLSLDEYINQDTVLIVRTTDEELV